MNYTVLDLEATCWKQGTRPDRMETIEIGAVRADGDTGIKKDEFSCFIRPVSEPTLSAFCTELTGITQGDVDDADTFPQVFPRFLGWLGVGSLTLCTWGAYDVNQLRIDCRRHRMNFPGGLNSYVNLKTTFARAHNMKPCGMKRALNILGIPLAGSHHRGIDDARNITGILITLLQQGIPIQPAE